MRGGVDGEGSGNWEGSPGAELTEGRMDGGEMAVGEEMVGDPGLWAKWGAGVDT